MDYKIQKAEISDISILLTLQPHPNETYFQECFKRPCDIYIIYAEDQKAAGYAVLNKEPKYSFYKKLKFPEIQDLNVLKEHRQKGYATALITFLETLCQEEGFQGVGISVGLTKDYGPAQRLYIKLGYVPDGFGLTYDRQYVESGQSVTVDDDLCLMLVKEF